MLPDHMSPNVRNGRRNETVSLQSPRLVRAAVAIGNVLAPERTLALAQRLLAASTRGGSDAVFKDGGEKSYVSYQGIRIAVRRWGIPALPRILLAHDWADDSRTFHAWLEPLLHSGHSVVAFDHVGHGASEGTPSPLNFKDVLREITAQIGPVAAIIAHGQSALASMQVLSERPFARKAILLSPPTDASAPVRAFARAIGLSVSLAQRLVDATDPAGEQNLPPWLRAPAIACPALIIHDLDDEVVPWVDGECYARHWRNSRLLTTTGLGHAGIAWSLLSVESALRFLRGDLPGTRVVASPDVDALGVR